jgi:hypothetical protein
MNGCRNLITPRLRTKTSRESGSTANTAAGGPPVRDLLTQKSRRYRGATGTPDLGIVLWRSVEILTTLIAQSFPFARPNIQIYDAQVVGLYPWVCALYLVGVKSAETTAKRDLSSALDRISERITTDFQPRGPWRRERNWDRTVSPLPT